MKLIFLTCILFLVSLNTYSFERPDLAISPKINFLCKSGKSLTHKKFDKFCATNSRENKTNLYVYFDLSDEVLFHSQFVAYSHMRIGSLYQWCTQEIIDPATGEPQTTNPACVVEVINKRTKDKAHLAISYLNPKNNIIEVNVDALIPGDTHYAILKEVSGGVQSKTFLIHIKR